MYDAIVEACDLADASRGARAHHTGFRRRLLVGHRHRAVRRRPRPAPTASPTNGASARSSNGWSGCAMPTIAAIDGAAVGGGCAHRRGVRLPRLRRYRRLRRAGGPHARQLPVAGQLRAPGRSHRPGPRRRPADDRSAGAADEALAWGLASRVVPVAELEAVTLGWRRAWRPAPPSTITATKAMLRRLRAHRRPARRRRRRSDRRLLRQPRVPRGRGRLRREARSSLLNRDVTKTFQDVAR